MKINKSRLRQIIKEELANLSEVEPWRVRSPNPGKERSRGRSHRRLERSFEDCLWKHKHA